MSNGSLFDGVQFFSNKRVHPYKKKPDKPWFSFIQVDLMFQNCLLPSAFHPSSGYAFSGSYRSFPGHWLIFVSGEHGKFLLPIRGSNIIQKEKIKDLLEKAWVNPELWSWQIWPFGLPWRYSEKRNGSYRIRQHLSFIISYINCIFQTIQQSFVCFLTFFPH